MTPLQRLGNCSSAGKQTLQLCSQTGNDVCLAECLLGSATIALASRMLYADLKSSASQCYPSCTAFLTKYVCVSPSSHHTHLQVASHRCESVLDWSETGTAPSSPVLLALYTGTEEDSVSKTCGDSLGLQSTSSTTGCSHCRAPTSSP